MLTFDECKAVAEEVWGWCLYDFYSGHEEEMKKAFEKCSPPPEGTVKRIYFDEKKRRCTQFYRPIDLQNVVCSWAGFGKSINAMEDKGFHFFADDYITFQRIDGQAQADGDPQFTTGRKLKSKNGGMVPATHRAALEAVRIEKA